MKIGKKQTIIVGPPGCGKTTKCLELMEHHLRMGVDPERIAFVSFTKAAVEVAKSRAKKLFGFKDKRLPWFRTLHSIAFKKTAMALDSVMQEKNYQEFEKLLGNYGAISVANRQKDEMNGIFFGSNSDADFALYMDSKARGMMIDWEELYHLEAPKIERLRAKYAIVNYHHYMKVKGLFDFTDMLEIFIEQGEPLDVDVVFIDEAQDLNKLQWHVAFLAFANAEQVYIAGDDDQAIYKWSGADVDLFQSMEGERLILDQSYRLPSKIHHQCMRVIEQVDKRIPKEFKPRAEVGNVEVHFVLDRLLHHDLTQGEWLILGRNRHQLYSMKRLLMVYGYVFVDPQGYPSTTIYQKNGIDAWTKLQRGGYCTYEQLNDLYRCMMHNVDYDHDKTIFMSGEEYCYSDLVRFRGLLIKKDIPWYDALHGIAENKRIYYRNIIKRNGGKWEKPRIRLSTIHAAKGDECDNVLLLTEMSKKSHTDLLRNPSDEHRVFYVGMSRAKESLHIVAYRVVSNSKEVRKYPYLEI